MEYNIQKVQQHSSMHRRCMVHWQKGSFNHIQMPGSQQFQDAFGITIDAASCFCSCCMYSMAKRNTATAKVLPQRCSIVTYQCTTQMRTPWYERNTCMLSYCMIHKITHTHFQNLRACGRPKTLQHCGRHYSKYANHLIRHMKGIAPTSLNVPGMQPPAHSI